MEEELRLSLLVLGGCFILAVLAHGIWNIRKNNQRKNPPRVEPHAWEGDDVDDASTQSAQDDGSEFDELGIGKVRVISAAKDPEEANELENSTNSTAAFSATKDPQSPSATETEATESQVSTESPENTAPEVEHEVPLYGSVVSNPKPHLVVRGECADNLNEFGEPPGFLLKDEVQNETQKSSPESRAHSSDGVADFSLDIEPLAPESQASQGPDKNTTSVKRSLSRKKPRVINRKRTEPNFGEEEQMRIDFDESLGPKTGQQPAPAKPVKAEAAAQEVLILNVRAPDDEPISGAALLPMLLTLGFKFGDQDIFHRHVNSNGKGPVLFSLANMFKPGNFDIDNLETFTTNGVSLFMLLPIEGEPHQVFNMMHNAARKIADEFHGQVLDGRRSVLTKQGLQQYMEKIREFERKRIIARP
jgi:cell division protein ZipA